MRKITHFCMMLALSGLALSVLAQLFTSCERRPLEEEYAQTALIPVRIDWSRSNIPVTEPHGGEHVHRVSVRFFPKDGSPAFDRYLENNVMEGEIEVPVGDYRVVVFNEAVSDVYWQDAIVFNHVDDFDLFAATIVDDDAANHPHYTPIGDEQLKVEPFLLASWSLDDFEVTTDMVVRSRASRGAPLTGDEPEGALTRVVMRPLTRNVNVSARVENLVSVHLMQAAKHGFAHKVYMASAITEHAPATHTFRLSSRVWHDDQQKHGTLSKRFLSFGQLPSPSQYMLHLNAVLVDGSIHEGPLLFDVTSQVLSHAITDIDINVDVDLAMPVVSGGISVDGWDDDTIIIK